MADRRVLAPRDETVTSPMALTDILLVLVLLALGMIVGLQWHNAPIVTPPAPLQPPPVPTDPAARFRGSAAGYFKVLSAPSLLELAGAAPLVERIMNLSKVSRAEFDRDLLPAIHRFAEWAQLMPASEAHHHANLGGLLAHTLETLHHALVQREGYLPMVGGVSHVKDAGQ